MNNIDFVITWVDGNDSLWQKEKSKYKKDGGNDSSNVRYRDYGVIKYLFRSIEKYAPWVNKIYFITWGHLPKWLNTEHPKLVIVNHEDFIPEEYLPTFNSCAIELNFGRIKELSNHFVYFNDDMLINDFTSDKDFFKNGLPCDTAVLNAIIPYGKSNFEHRLVNNSNVINRHFDMMKVIKNNPSKWLSLKYGKDIIRTLCLLPWKKFSTIKQYHVPISFCKKYFELLWKIEPQLMKESCVDKFRSFFGVNPWVIQMWQICEGNFYPRSANFGKMYILGDNNDELYKDLQANKHKLLCLNDNADIKDFEKTKEEILNALNKKFSEKSSFEK